MQTDLNPTSPGCDVAEPGSAELSQVILSFRDLYVVVVKCSMFNYQVVVSMTMEVIPELKEEER